MLIKSLKLSNFRNYSGLNLSFAKNFNVIYGDNAQGKTNILEAVFLCASGRSHRTSRDADLVKIGEQGYYVKLEILKNEALSSIEVKFENNEKKKVAINEIPQKKIGNLMGHFNCVIFSPEDLMIIKEGPSERRRFLDITISQVKPAYFYDLQQYTKILMQRNTLLREIANNKGLLETLDVWDINLIKTGSRIMRVRREFIERLGVYARKNHNILTDGNEDLSINYVPSISIDTNGDLSQIEAAFSDALAKIRRKEILKSTTLCGPQRDDYDILLNGKSTKLYGSQGQQRTSVLSLKLAEIDIMKNDTGEYPVLLLDDVMSELDGSRQQYLFDNLYYVQTFITCTDRSFFENRPLKDYKYIKVSRGTVLETEDGH